MARHPQLAVYQLAVREGAVDAAFDGTRPEPGGAELVHLRQGAAKRDGGDSLPKIQTQQPLEGSGSANCSPRPRARSSTSGSPPSAGQHCTHCAFRASCSARPEGRHVVE
ncbi:hypothetical protein GCM10020256_24780 [Streptomyces thermocoprophilus]